MARIPGNAIVGLTTYFMMDSQLGIITRNFSALTNAFDVEWDTTEFFGVLIANGWTSTLKLAMSDNAQYLGMKLAYRPFGGPSILASNTAEAGPCVGGTGNAPTQLSGLLSWESSIGGPKGRGRDYVPFPFAEAVAADGRPTAFYQEKLGTVGASIADGMVCTNVGAGGGTCTVYPCTKARFTALADLPARLSTYLAARGFATQRRRGYFGKQNRNPF